jgi:hypothetical protein
MTNDARIGEGRDRRGHAIDHSFGAEAVETQERRERIRAVFQAVAPRYDLMNDLMSFGIHRLWKRVLARRVQGGLGQGWPGGGPGRRHRRRGAAAAGRRGGR